MAQELHRSGNLALAARSCLSTLKQAFYKNDSQKITVTQGKKVEHWGELQQAPPAGGRDYGFHI
jgi:hypothetical protein